MRHTAVRRIVKPPRNSSKFSEVVYFEPNWFLKAQINPEPEAGISDELRVRDKRTDTWLHYVADMFCGFPYVAVDGPARDAVAARLAEVLPVFTDEEIFAMWDDAQDVDDRVDAVLHLGVAAPPEKEQDPEFERRIRSALDDEDTDVRNAAIMAVGYRGWAVFKERIEEMHENDPDETARQRCRVVLDNWHEP